MAEDIPRYERLVRVARDAARQFDDERECTCDEDFGNCWYRLTPEEQDHIRMAYIAQAVAEEDEGDG